MDLNLTPLAQHPEHREASSRIVELEAARTKLRSRIAEIEVQLNAQIPEEQSTAGHLNAALDFLKTGVATPSGSYVANLRDEHVTLRAQLDAVEKVLKDRTHARLQLESQLSADVTARIKDQHEAICDRFAQVLRDLDAVIGEEVALVVAVERLGYSPSFTRHVVNPQLGRINDSHSLLWHLAREFPVRGRR